MTSKRSFINIMKEDLKRRIWPLALSLVGFFFALPVLALIKLEDHMDSLIQGWDTLVSLQASFVHYTLGPNNTPAIAGLMIMASLNAIHGMKYLHSRQEADFYGSIPVLRTQKFAAAFVNGILLGIIPYIIMQLLAALIGASKGFVTAAGFSFAMQTLLLEIVGYILIYTVIVLAAILTGHSAVTIAGAAVLSFGPLAYASLFEGYKDMFYITAYYEVRMDFFYDLSPFTAFFKLLWIPDGARDIAPFSYHMYNVTAAIICIVISAAIFLLSLKLIVMRPAESAGKSMAFEKTKPFIKVFIMIPVAMTFGAFFPSLTGSDSTYGWLIFGIVVGIILAHAAIEIIYEFDFKACIRHIPSGIVGGVITIAIVSFFVFDFSGYDTRLPDKEKIVSSAVCVPGIESTMYSKSYYWDTDLYSYGLSDSDVIMRDMKLQDTDDVYVLAQAGCEYAKKYRMHGRGPAEGIITEDTPHYIQVMVTLRKESGKPYTRSYYVDRDDSEIYAALSRIYDMDEYKTNTYDVLAKDDRLNRGKLDYIQYETAGSTETASNVSDADADRLLKAMAKETKALTLDQLKEESPVGYLEYELKPENTLGYSTWERPVGYVYPSFKETLSVLNELGIRTQGELNADDISFIVALQYDDDGNDRSERIEDAGEIKALIPDLVVQDYASANYAFFDVDYDITYEVHLKSRTSEGGYDGDNMIYCLMKK